MMDYPYSSWTCQSYPIDYKNSRITGEGRMRIRGANKQGDLKKHKKRKIAKQSKRANRK